MGCINQAKKRIVTVRVMNCPLWRGSLLPLGRVAVVVGSWGLPEKMCCDFFGTASQSSGSKLPRHI
ncbi:hypothetical protein PS723_05822 [Pseudomonas fluorescens]|uniref:Uncharacterized protein n=1 Tax=Pseudomonas fluorescens TaxID=294 RepID=A0A5E7FNU6_PSEFL|nr:hypothetical protein PS723_05822 [Pseudomonas fluorescens]